MNAQLSHQRLLFVNKQHQNCANIDAAMNYSESTSWGKGFIAFLSVNKLLIIFTVSFDVFDGQSSTTDSFGRFSLNSNSLPSSERTPRLMASFPPNIHKEKHVCFKILNQLSPFPVKFVSLLLFDSSRWKFCFRAVSGNPNIMHMEILLLVGWNWIWYYFFLFRYFRKFWPGWPYISGRREYMLVLEYSHVELRELLLM